MTSSRFSPWTGGVLAAALVLAAGCSDSSPTAPEGTVRPLPATFWLIGSASSTESDGSTVNCSLDLAVTLSSQRALPDGLEYDGILGGSLQRTVLDAQGNGIGLWPDVHGRVIARSLVPDRVEFLIPENANTDSRFWRELARIEGRFDAAGQVTGSWRCAPFDIDEGGYVDLRYTAQGTWRLDPAP